MTKKFSRSARVKGAQLQALRREFKLLHMSEGEKVIAYCSRTMDICKKMRFPGESMAYVVIVEQILRSLDPKCDYVRIPSTLTV